MTVSTQLNISKAVRLFFSVSCLFIASLLSFTASSAEYESNKLQIVITPDGFPIIWKNSKKYSMDFTITLTSYGWPSPGQNVGQCYDSFEVDGLPNGLCSASAYADGAHFYKEFYINGVGKVRVYYKLDSGNVEIVGTHQLTVFMAFQGNFNSAIANDTYDNSNDVEVVGTISGSFEVSQSGAAVYNVPIVMPPGVAGMKPDLAFAHNTQSSNGHMGVGWSLSGLSTISRCAKTLATDSVSGKISFSENTFCLDGQRLLPNSNVANEYSTELESFARVKWSGGTVNNPLNFIVKTKAGLTYHYKRVLKETARIWSVDKIVDTAGNKITYHYFEDTTQGEYYVNEVRYAYVDDSAYNAKIIFDYENDRSDKFSGWVAGDKVAIDGRLRHVKTFARDNLSSNFQLGRDYRIKYQKDPESGSSLLSAMKLCAIASNNPSTNECYKETTFAWDTTDASLGNRVAAGYCADGDGCISGENSESNFIYYPDINGDGLTDMCYLATAGVQCYTGNGSGGWGSAFPVIAECAGGSQLGLCFTTFTYPDENYGQVTRDFKTRNTIQFVDINGDGLDDFVYRGKNGIRYAISKGASFEAVRSTTIFGIESGQTYKHVNSTSYNNLYFPDLDGNGVRDLCYRAFTGIKCHKGTGNDAAPWLTAAYSNDFNNKAVCAEGSHSWGRCDQTDNYPTIRFVDIDGDRKDDLVYRGDEGLRVWYSTGNGFSYDASAFNVPYVSFINGEPSAQFSLCLNAGNGTIATPYNNTNGYVFLTCGHEQASSIQFADVNGDGLVDLCYRATQGVTCWKNKGSDVLENGYKRWVDPVVTDLCANNSSSRGRCDSDDNFSSIRFLDLNGDGKSDLTYRGDEGLQFFLSTGDDFKHHWATDICSNGSVQHGVCNDKNNWSNIRYGDFNGDGRADLVVRGDQGIQTWVNNNYRSNLLTGLTNGLGESVSIEHKRLTDNSVYSKGVNDYFAGDQDREIQPAMCVVSSYSRDNGIGGKNTTEYLYSDLKASLHSRGLLGFSKIESTDAKDVANTVNLHQYYPYTGMVKTSSVTESGKKISSTENIVDSVSFDGGVKFPYVRRAHESSYLYPSNSKETQTTTDAIYDDYGNVTSLSVLTKEIVSGKEFKKTTNNNYGSNIADLQDGRLKTATVTHTEADGTEQARSSSFTYHSGTALLKAETIEPTGSGVTNTYPVNPLTTSYVYDNYGNQVLKTVTGADITSRTTTTIYDDSKRFIKTISNAKGHIEEREYDAMIGKMTLQLGPYTAVGSITRNKAVQTIWQYDGFGREKEKRVHDQTGQNADVVSTASYDYCVISCPSFSAKYSITSQILGLPATTAYFDLLGREVVKENAGFDGDRILVETEYDEFGRASRKTRPYQAGTSKKWSTTYYDVLDRIERLDEPSKTGYATTEIEYLTGLRIKTTNPLGQVNIVTSDSLGRKVSVENAALKMMTYGYTYSGNAQIKTTVDSMANAITTTTDVRDNKREMTDPDMGRWQYEYNALGELVMQKDARGVVTRMTYDELGRMKTRIDAAEGTTSGHLPSTTSWIYDTFYPGKMGVIMNPQFYRVYIADSLGRTKAVNSSYSGTMYTAAKTFDNYGRDEVLTYPNAVAVRNIYNANGYLEKVVDEADHSSVHWQANFRDAEGNLTNFTYGNGFNTISGFEFGRLDSSGTGIGSDVQTHTYTYDELGNLKSRTMLTPAKLGAALTETFDYDVLNRLKESTILGVTATNTYDDIGNLKTKTSANVGSPTLSNYIYDDPSHKKRLMHVTGGVTRNYVYDANGNITNSGDTTFVWTTYNKINVMYKGSSYEVYNYDENRSRYRKYHTSGGIVDYIMPENNIGVHYEKHTKGSVVTNKNYIYAGGSMVAIKSETSGASSMEYLHKDHLGSVTMVTDQNANVISERSFDAFGANRSNDWATSYLSVLPPSLFKTATYRGYTGHEQIADFNLINMNGRIYDPAVGRFLSADPFVQYEDNMQSLNRYAYVMNNPLAATDPSGYFLKKLLRAAIVVAIAVYAPQFFEVLSGTFASFTTAVPSFGAIVAGGGAAGFANGLLSGGGLSGAIEGGFSSAFSATLFAGAHSVSNNLVTTKIAVHGLAGGLSSEIQGGSFKSGFLSAGFTNAVGATGAIDGTKFEQGFQAAIIGGTASVIGGGKFANGAITGAFSRLFNDLRDWNAKALRGTEKSYLPVGSPYRGVYHEGEWHTSNISNIDVTSFVPAKLLTKGAVEVIKYATTTVDQVRIVVTGEYQNVEVYEYQIVYDIYKGNDVNVNRIFNSETRLPNDRIAIGNKREHIEPRTCYLGNLNC